MESEDTIRSYKEATKAYLSSAGRTSGEDEENYHIAHFECRQDCRDIPPASFHITLDIDKAKIKVRDSLKLSFRNFRKQLV